MTTAREAQGNGPGHGLVGVRERVKIYGGEMTAGAVTGGGFILSTRLPLSGTGHEIRVLVADDQPWCAPAFACSSPTKPDIEVVAEARNGLEAVDEGGPLRPDRRSDGHPHARARRPRGDPADPRRRQPRSGPHPHDIRPRRVRLRSTHAGASGFVLKDDPPEQLLAAIRTVAVGDALLSPAVTRRVIRQFARIPTDASQELDELTARELEVFRLIARGLSNAEIGESSSSATPRSRHTSRTSSRSSTSATASKQSCSHTRPGSSKRTRGNQVLATSARPADVSLPFAGPPLQVGRHARTFWLRDDSLRMADPYPRCNPNVSSQKG